MSTGEKFVTSSKMDVLRRKIESILAGRSIIQISQISPTEDDIESVVDLAVTVEEKTDDYLVVADDFGKILMMNAGAAKTFMLPAVEAGDIGLSVTLVKRGAGALAVQAAAGETIQDSSAGGTVYNDLAEETFALVRLCVIAAATWIIEFFTGSGWRTS
jgi:hypothetical protein